jgi:hypothetical protein
MENNIYAINSILKKMKSPMIIRFLSLSTLIVDLQFQFQPDIDLIDVTEEQLEQLKETLDKSEISNVYKTYDLFNQLKTYSTKSLPIKKLHSVFDKDGNSSEFNEALIRLFNVVFLVNLIQKRLKKKTIEELDDYKLIDKMAHIHPELINFLSLNKLSSVETNKEFEKNVEEYISYDDIDFDELYKLYENNYKSIYQLFDLFR